MEISTGFTVYTLQLTVEWITAIGNSCSSNKVSKKVSKEVGNNTTTKTSIQLLVFIQPNKLEIIVIHEIATLT